MPINLGTCKGVSVLEMVSALSKVVGKKLEYQLVARRPGDVAVTYSDATRAEQLLGWKAQLGLEAMCADSWRWQSKNPQGY